MSKLVCGVGVNDLGYRTQINEEVTKNGGKRIQKPVFQCKYYAAWKNMLERCYSKKFLESRPTYIGTSVCSEWLYASGVARAAAQHCAPPRYAESGFCRHVVHAAKGRALERDCQKPT